MLTNDILADKYLLKNYQNSSMLTFMSKQEFFNAFTLKSKLIIIDAVYDWLTEAGTDTEA